MKFLYLKIFLFTYLLILSGSSLFAQKDTTRYVILSKSKEIEVHQGDSVFIITYDHMAGILLMDGIEKAKAGDLDGALEDFRSTFLYTKKNADVYYNIGLIYYYKKQNTLALEYLNKAIEIAPEHFDALNQRGIVLSLLNRNDDALEDFNNAIEVKPFDGQSYLNKGVVLLQKGENDEACGYFRKAFELGNEKAEDIINTYCK